MSITDTHGPLINSVDVPPGTPNVYNKDNEWLQFLQGGPRGTPYLKSTGRLKEKPKVVHVSSRQRRIINGR